MNAIDLGELAMDKIDFLKNQKTGNKHSVSDLFICIWFYFHLFSLQGFPGGTVVKNLPAKAGAFLHQEDSRSRKWQPTLVFLPGKYHGQRTLERYSPLGCKESDMTE